ncbi:MAG: histidine phosphatase family protein [Spirochaetaceae bacterium]|nr:MAG: histidine phosphatase family protein [Spirochaetaceae bacterium]
MKEVLVLRHAKAEPAHGPLEDHERDLAPSGISAAREVGKRLVELGLLPERILCSDAVRARRTAEMSSSEMPSPPSIELFAELYTADSHDYFELLQKCPPEINRVLIVAHNPTVEVFLGQASGRELAMKTAALAVLRFETSDWRSVVPGAAVEPARLLS